ncbi:tyrosine-type recombinase/integrase [Enterovibrio nigricans]|uniref:Phage integrase family protein n=1 Tax=Enterovibrio nigricans DSM 22720 TaxID=1121868 RepID=A0A1T4VEM5_9GAMM|nr:tyrosine-type recombinase/integrase [Enterovibrio nigricans]PKF49367.1 integrase [Enterovibrio nigricans]SKA63429.1 Phage integrase family protein [Enterovibrio nigricans DSM 22720]
MKKIEPILDQVEKKESMALFKQGPVDLEAWSTLTNNKYSHNSLLSFQNDWITFVTYCREVNVSPLPAAVTAVRRFIEHSAKTRKASSIKRYIITLSLMHRVHSLPDPTRNREVRFTLNRLYQEKSDDALQANAFMLSHLTDLANKFGSSEKLKDIRDLLIWMLCFEGMLKRSELAALPHDAPRETEDGFVLAVDEHLIELSEEAKEQVEKWQEATGITDGPLLRGINKHGHLSEAPMDHSSIYRVFRRAATELGLEGRLTFSGQSPRVGASQELAEAGKTIKEIQHQGRWKSPAMPAQYVGNKTASSEAMDKFKRKIEKD